MDREIRDDRLVWPALGPIYRALDPWMDPLIRFTTGILLVPHGAQKLFGWFGGGGIAGTAAFLDKVGYSPGLFWAWVLGLLEFFGGLSLAVGFLTRPIALLVFIFMINAMIYHWPNGYFWNKLGWELPFFWAVTSFFCMVRGGGRYSVDALLRREI